jgi:TPP-dependent pyruvate/acetoin dehydrogenase alpha subunit
MAAARRHDPIPRFAQYLEYHGLLDDTLAKQLMQRAEAEIADALEYARQAPPPPVERAFADVYSSVK